MGGEFGQWNEWDFDQSLQWHLLEWDTHRGVQKCMADLQSTCSVARRPCTRSISTARGFYWIDCHNWEESTLTLRPRAKDPNDFLVVCCNFTPVPRHHHRIGVPKPCWYDEVFNSDSMYYGGSNMGNGAGIQGSAQGSHGQPASIELVLPPLATVVFKPARLERTGYRSPEPVSARR